MLHEEEIFRRLFAFGAAAKFRNGNRDHGKVPVALVLLPHLFHIRHFNTAERTPRRPEIQKEVFALVVRKVNRLSVLVIDIAGTHKQSALLVRKRTWAFGTFFFGGAAKHKERSGNNRNSCRRNNAAHDPFLGHSVLSFFVLKYLVL